MAKAYNSQQSAAREKRLRRFKSITLQVLALTEDVYEGKPGSGMYWIESSDFGKIVMYPKADRLHLVKKNKWMDRMESWLKQNIIKEKF